MEGKVKRDIHLERNIDDGEVEMRMHLFDHDFKGGGEKKNPFHH